MTSYPIPPEVLGNHTAVLGKTGSGKSSTTRLIVEEVVPQDFRVCIIDPLKSDWWGITSSADGRAPGLPFRILGGPRGHVGLPPTAGAAIGRLVGQGKLPLSILDMAEFGPGDPQRFFVEFAEAMWRHQRGVTYLVMEEAHEFAPKEKAGLGAESMATHWMKKLATGGRSKGIRLIVATQRVQALHNAVLGSCETLIAHRLTLPADQKPVIDWLKANVDKATVEAVAGSLASLPTGTGWLCSGEARIFQKVAFPKFCTFDNTATPTGDDDEVSVATAAVDQDELHAILGEAVKEAKANDPKALKAEIARLNSEVAQIRKAGGAPDPAALQDAENRGRLAGWGAGVAEGEKRGIVATLDRVAKAVEVFRADPPSMFISAPSNEAPKMNTPPPAPTTRAEAPQPLAASRQTASAAAVTGAQQRILNALAWWAAFGITQPTNEQVGFAAGYAPGSGNFNNLRGGLRAAGLIDYPAPGCMALTPDGLASAEAPDSGDLSTSHFHSRVRSKLNGPQIRLLDPVLSAYPGELTSEALAQAAGYAAGSGNFNNLRGSLRSIGLIDYPAPGQVRAADWLFPEN